MNGATRPWWVIPALVFGSVAFYGVVGWIILKAYRRLREFVESSHRRAFKGLEIHGGPAPCLVAVVFHTYWGFIAFTHHQKHCFWAPPDDARQALMRLHRFNMTWGFFAHGAILIPIVSFCNFLSQKRSISKQDAAMRENSELL